MSSGNAYQVPMVGPNMRIANLMYWFLDGGTVPNDHSTQGQSEGHNTTPHAKAKPTRTGAAKTAQAF